MHPSFDHLLYPFLFEFFPFYCPNHSTSKKGKRREEEYKGEGEKYLMVQKR